MEKLTLFVFLFLSHILYGQNVALNDILLKVLEPSNKRISIWMRDFDGEIFYEPYEQMFSASIDISDSLRYRIRGVINRKELLKEMKRSRNQFYPFIDVNLVEIKNDTIAFKVMYSSADYIHYKYNSKLLYGADTIFCYYNCSERKWQLQIKN